MSISMSMTMTIAQKLNFLHMSFDEYDVETLFLILQSKQYVMNEALQTLFAMQNPTVPPPAPVNQPPPSFSANHSLTHVPSTPAPTPSGNTNPFVGTNSVPQQQSSMRGTPVTLPNDFLRFPTQVNNTQTNTGNSGTTDYLTLFSDPAFLEEMRREFGPDFEAVLREHMQAEAMRNTANYSTYNSPAGNYIPPQQQPIQSYAPQANTMESMGTTQSNSVSPPPPPQPEVRKPMEGIGSSEDDTTTSSGPSISHRFQGILSKFMPSNKSGKKSGKGSAGLLASHYDEESEDDEEKVFINSSSDQGVEMKSANQKDDDDLDESTHLLN